MDARSAVRLGVNIDHVATIRNARGGIFPDPVLAARVAVDCGADGITAHLREDRRHIRDEDLRRLKIEIAAPLNLEMAATEEMTEIALQTLPHACCIVPERRSEITTEGGLDAAGKYRTLAPVVKRLGGEGIRVSLFIDPNVAQIEAALGLSAAVVELHTGKWCQASIEGRFAEADEEFDRIAKAAEFAAKSGIEVHAGHGLDLKTAASVAAVPEITELNIGHFLIGEAIFTGLPEAIRRMRAAIAAGIARRSAAG